MKAFLNILGLSSILFSQSLFANEYIRLISDITIETGTKYKDTEIGGLSGISYEASTNKIIAVSDDRSWVNPSRIYEFDLKIDAKNFSLNPTNVLLLKDKDGKHFAQGETDFEGISLVGNKIYLSSEGNINDLKLIMPALYVLNRNGEYEKELEVPKKYLPQKDRKNFGARENLVFEALSTSLDGKTTFMGMEEALIQDGDKSSTTRGSLARIIKYQNEKPFSEYAYQLEKIEEQILPGVPSSFIKPGDNGLVDLAIIDENNFYSLERSYLPSARRNVIRIFKCKIDKDTSDISSYQSLNGKKINLIKKTLVSNLEEFVPFMNVKKLDNIEAMTLGPKLSNGNYTLIVSSDNNFGKGQRTMFMAFEILK